mmetsp:Transcript_4511/g.9047  ORF Transcript_4511/g.9047 Transcript_4511/m.9047 type:complete len:437 (-) Transcript_4511:86-1396(-)
MPAAVDDWLGLDDLGYTQTSLEGLLGDGEASFRGGGTTAVPPLGQGWCAIGAPHTPRDALETAVWGGSISGDLEMKSGVMAMMRAATSSTESEGGGGRQAKMSLASTSSEDVHSALSSKTKPMPRKRRMTPESKSRRQMNNKRAAARYRQKRKVYMEGLETKVKSLSKALEQKEKEFDRLQTSNSVLTEQLKFLKNLLGDHPGAKAGAALQMLVCLAGLVCVFVTTLPEQGMLAGCYPPSRGLLSVNTPHTHETPVASSGVGAPPHLARHPHPPFYGAGGVGLPPTADVCVRPAPSWAQPAWDLGGSPGCFGGSAVVSTLRVLLHAVVMIIWINVCAYYISVSRFRGGDGSGSSSSSSNPAPAAAPANGTNDANPSASVVAAANDDDAAAAAASAAAAAAVIRPDPYEAIAGIGAHDGGGGGGVVDAATRAGGARK